MKSRLGLVLACATLVLFSFQNCGRSNFQTFDGENLLTSSGINVTKDTTVVPFEVGLDAIAYNSCVPNNRAAEAYFTIKASAGGTRGGARLTSAFMTDAATQLRPILGNSQVLDVQYKQLIEATIPEAEVQMALRSTTDYRATYTGKAPAGVWGRMGMLSHDSWLTPLVESARKNGNQWVPYSARAPSASSRFDFSFSQDFSQNDYWSNLYGGQGFRTCVSQGCQGFGRFVMALGYSEPADKNSIRGPAFNSTQVSAYGRGYLLQFGYPDNKSEAGMRVVKGIQEYNLQNQTPIVENNVATRWSCTEIPIMSSVQRGTASNPQTSSWDRVRFAGGSQEALCNPMQGNFVATYYSALNIAKIREFLPSHQWQLGFQNTVSGSRLCAIPIGFDCYPNEPFPNIQNNGSQQPYPYYVSYKPGTLGDEVCINEDNMGTELSKVGAAAIDRVCAHYITVCIKQ